MDGVSLKKELKQWEHDFIKKYNRSPKRNDIDKVPAIKSKYKIYSKFKNQKINVNKTPIKTDLTNEDTINNDLIDELVNEEFGPTPQIYGKSISLFEINLSPVKKRLDLSEIDALLNDTDDDDDDDTINITQEEDVAIENLVPHTENINDIPSIRHESKPIYGPNSPLKIESSLKLHQTTPRRNLNLDLTENATPLGISPSPLFKRSFTKSLKELENEFQTVRKELKLDDINEDDSDNGEKMEGSEDNINTTNDSAVEEQEVKPLPDIQKNTTLKRKRRNIIKRVHDSNDDRDTAHKNLDLHAMLRNIKRTKLKEFIDKESISLSSALTNKLEMEDVKLNKNNDEDNKPVEKPIRKKRKSKYNLVSNNFRRLKLPTKSRRNAHRGRRR